MFHQLPIICIFYQSTDDAVCLQFNFVEFVQNLPFQLKIYRLMEQYQKIIVGILTGITPCARAKQHHLGIKVKGSGGCFHP